MSQTPAGWYPQPDGSEHYWDGTAWTEQIRPAASPQPLHPQPPQPQPPEPHSQPPQPTGGHQGTEPPAEVFPNGLGAMPAPDSPTAADGSGAAADHPEAKPPWFKRKGVLVTLGAVLLLCVIAIASSGDSTTPDPQATTTTKTLTETTTATVTETPATATVTETTTKPGETTTVTAAPTPSPFDEMFGTFEPITQTGRGDTVINLPAGANAGLVTLTHKGSGNIQASLLTANNQPTVALLVNDIGNYSGTTAFGLLEVGEPGVKIKLTADGSWTLTIAPISKAPQLAGTNSGKGDHVFLFEDAAANWAITHQGDGNFAVTAVGGTAGPHGQRDRQLHRHRADGAGPLVVQIKADGAWTMTRTG